MSAMERVSLARHSGGKVIAVYVADVVCLAHLSGCGEYSGMIREGLSKEGEKALKMVGRWHWILDYPVKRS
jgi:hypothetical protein